LLTPSAAACRRGKGGRYRRELGQGGWTGSGFGAGSYGARVPQPEVSVRPVTAAELPVLDRLWLMFRHDMSEFHGGLPRPDGTFRTEHLRAAVEDPGWVAYLAWTQDRPIGFALVRALDQPVRVLNAFFIVRGLRRTGIASQVVRDVLSKHPGFWEVAFQAANQTAVRFWRRTATDIAGQHWTEEPRAVPTKPDAPPDLWISFSTTATAW